MNSLSPGLSSVVLFKNSDSGSASLSGAAMSTSGLNMGTHPLTGLSFPFDVPGAAKPVACVEALPGPALSRLATPIC